MCKIQLPKSVRTMKKMEKIIPLSFTPPWDSMPLYITMFQSSPVRIYEATLFIKVMFKIGKPQAVPSCIGEILSNHTKADRC